MSRWTVTHIPVRRSHVALGSQSSRAEVQSSGPYAGHPATISAKSVAQPQESDARAEGLEGWRARFMGDSFGRLPRRLKGAALGLGRNAPRSVESLM